MKNRNRIIGLARVAMLGLVVAALTACDTDEFTRTAGSIPGEEELTTIGGVLRREKTPEQTSILKITEGQPTVDGIFYQLTQPATAEVNVTVDIDETLVEEFNKGQTVKLKLFPVDKVTFAEGKMLTVAKGQKVSGILNITLTREGVEQGTYLLPLRAKIGNGEAQSAGSGQIIYYRVVVFKHVAESELDAYPFKIVGYVNTEEMNPLMGNEFFVTFMDFFNNIETTKTWIDIEILRKASVKFNGSNGRVVLDLGPDLQYVLSNRDQYIVPLQKKSRKVLFCITGGNTGLGFCNMTDAQIADFVYQVKYVVDTYKLDGVNFFDTDANYGKDNMPAIDPASYPKLINATKEAMGEKLVTVACDAESTEILAEPHDGIEAGEYIDYAWSGVFDEVIDAYADGSKLKPIAGLEQSKYGPVLLKTNHTSKRNELRPVLVPALTSLYRETSSANLFVFWDMPTSNAGGYEKGCVDTFDILADAISDFDILYDAQIFMMEMSPDFKGYGKFTKDW